MAFGHPGEAGLAPTRDRGNDERGFEKRASGDAGRGYPGFSRFVFGRCER
jgi:hypothetical protein